MIQICILRRTPADLNWLNVVYAFQYYVSNIPYSAHFWLVAAINISFNIEPTYVLQQLDELKDHEKYL